MRLYYQEIPETALSTRLDFVADNLDYGTADFGIVEITNIARTLVPSYSRRIRNELISNEEKKLLKEFFEDDFADITDYNPLIDEVFDNIDFDIQYTKSEIANILAIYKKEKKNNFGNRLNQLADILAASKKLCLSAEELGRIIGFVKFEIRKIAVAVGDDY